MVFEILWVTARPRLSRKNLILPSRSKNSKRSISDCEGSEGPLKTQHFTAVLFVEPILDPVHLEFGHRIDPTQRVRSHEYLGRLHRHRHRDANRVRRWTDRDDSMISKQDNFGIFSVFLFKVLYISPDPNRQREARVLIRDQHRHGSATNDFIRESSFFGKRGSQTRAEDLIDRDRVRMTDKINPGKGQQVSVEKGFHRGLQCRRPNPGFQEYLFDFLFGNALAIQDRKQGVEITVG